LAAAGRKVWVAAQWIFAAIVVWYAVRSLAGQWDEVGTRVRSVRPVWTLVAIASLLVLFTYAVLIEAWRRVLAGWNARLRWPDAARIWLASNLGKYVPGKVWSIVAMGALSRERGVSALTAGSSAVVMQAIAVGTCAAVAVAFGAAALESLWTRTLAVILLIAALVLAPRLLASAFALARSLTGREFPTPTLPTRAVVAAAASMLLVWLVSGIAFRLFANAFAITSGDTAGYISVYAASYLAGFVALFAPAGIGVRESALVATMERAGLATAPEAAVIAIASRLWLTLLEVVPGLIALLLTQRPAASATRIRDER
jgi:glycosyltransferase 2 family protein